jgi:hypothetical protein
MFLIKLYFYYNKYGVNMLKKNAIKMTKIGAKFSMLVCSTFQANMGKGKATHRLWS